jgi:hypothetical protein
MNSQMQHNDFTISVAGPNIDTTIVTMEEMQSYTNSRKRMSIVTTDKKTYGEMDRMNYQLVMNYTKPKAMAVNSKNKPYMEVHSWLLEKYKSGLIVIESDTVNEDIADMICKTDYLVLNDIDIIICREGFESITGSEIKKANLLRIHANPELNPMIFQSLQDFYQEKFLGIMICQFFCNDQYEQLLAHFHEREEEYTKSGMTDFVDYYQYNKQMAFFVYFDVEHNKILTVDKETLTQFMMKMNSGGMLPIPKNQIPLIAESLTIS